MKNQENSSSEYLAKEIDYLRSTYLELRKETRDLEMYAIVTVGAIWSWYVTTISSGKDHTNYSIVLDYILWLPHMVAILFGARAMGVYMQMRRTKKYLEVLEENANLPAEVGWEKYLNHDWSRAIWPITAVAFWSLLSIFTGIVAFGS